MKAQETEKTIPFLPKIVKCVPYLKKALILHAKYQYEMELTRTTGVRKNAESKKQIRKGNSSVRL